MPTPEPSRCQRAAAIIVVCLAGLAARPLAACVLLVPEQYPSIQAAIAAAADGCEIVVGPGTYHENINLTGKAVHLRSSGGPSVTTIDGSGVAPVVTCVMSEGPGTIVEGFTIQNGFSGAGGGMDNDGSSPTVRDCRFVDNVSTFLGGGMSNTNGASPTVIDCVFEGNTAVFGAGMFNRHVGTNPVVRGCRFEGNVASEAGGGMYNFQGAVPGIAECLFIGNVAQETIFEDSGQGGGMYNDESDAVVVGCVFDGNTGEVLGSGMYNTDCSPQVTNCLFVGNLDGVAALVSVTCTSTVTNCTVTGNATGGIGNDSGLMTVANCIVRGNTGGEILGTGLTVTFSNVAGGFPGTGNIDQDPMFVDPAAGDYRLAAGSPCIDAGSNAAVPADVLDLDGDGDTAEPVPLDLDGLSRFVDVPAAPDCPQAPGQCGTPPIVDMGPYEVQVCPADLTGPGPGDPPDGAVNVFDLLALLAAFGTPGPLGDITGPSPGDPPDGIVNVFDLLALLAVFGQDCPAP